MNHFNIYPAIDLKDGHCVRLLHGEMDKATVFSNSPADQAKQFEAAGFEWLHVVDLNGAFTGQSENADAISAILASTQLKVQLGGGIRTIEHIRAWLERGIHRVILGTVALRNPALVKEACALFPGQIVVGIDARQGLVAVEGWAEQSDMSALELAKKFEDAGVAAIIYTDIGRDGAMQGPNLEETAQLAEQISIPVILSGGITRPTDVHATFDAQARGISGVIIGRALYEGSVTPADLQRYLKAA